MLQSMASQRVGHDRETKLTDRLRSPAKLVSRLEEVSWPVGC